jgi:hypothetical protein
MVRVISAILQQGFMVGSSSLTGAAQPILPRLSVLIATHVANGA